MLRVCVELMRALLAAIGERLLGLDRERVRQPCLVALSRHTPSADSTALAAGVLAALSTIVQTAFDVFNCSHYVVHYPAT